MKLRLDEWTLLNVGLLAVGCYVAATWLVMRILKNCQNELASDFEDLTERNKRETENVD